MMSRQQRRRLPVGQLGDRGWEEWICRGHGVVLSNTRWRRACSVYVS